MNFKILKSGQGRYVRVATGVGAAAVALVVCYYVWTVLNRNLGAVAYRTYLEYAIPAVLFAVLGVVGYVMLNRPNVVDFFIATEGEMKKVSWSSRAELFGSTMVVIVVVVLLAAFIYVADNTVIHVFTRWLKLW